MLSFIALLEIVATPFDPALKTRLRRWALARETERELRRLDAATLSDVGILPEDITAKSWEHAWQVIPAEDRAAPRGAGVLAGREVRSAG